LDAVPQVASAIIGDVPQVAVEFREGQPVDVRHAGIDAGRTVDEDRLQFAGGVEGIQAAVYVGREEGVRIASPFDVLRTARQTAELDPFQVVGARPDVG